MDKVLNLYKRNLNKGVGIRVKEVCIRVTDKRVTGKVKEKESLEYD